MRSASGFKDDTCSGGRVGYLVEVREEVVFKLLCIGGVAAFHVSYL